MLAVTILYPRAEGSTFDMDYYTSTHMPMLADAFGDLAIPTMAAAGTAAHLGLGARAVALSEVALSRMLAMHADGSEARITLALGLCQVGDSDRALATLLEIREPAPYSQAVTAVAAAMSGMADKALEESDLAVEDDTLTYLDRLLANIAACAAFMPMCSCNVSAICRPTL